MLDEKIDDEEFLYRRVPSFPSHIKDGKVTSAIFKDSAGVSVDRQAVRNDEAVVNELFNEHPNIAAIAKIKTQVCRGHNTLPKYLPVLEGENMNIYHSEIHDSEDKVTLSKSKAQKLKNDSLIHYAPARTDLQSGRPTLGGNG